MTFTATVRNGTIPVPPEVTLPEGAEVEVYAKGALPRHAASEPEGVDNGPKEGDRDEPKPHRHEWMRKYIGIITDGPSDMAAEHDHYLYGTRKRSER